MNAQQAGTEQAEAGRLTDREEAVAFAHWLERAVNAHDVAGLEAGYADDAVLISPVFRETVGRAAIAKSWEAIFQLFPDWQVKILEVLVDGNRLAFVGTCMATDLNGWFGLPPTGERISYRAVILLTLHNGKIARDQRMYDLTGVLDQLEKARLDQELKTAAQVQSALLSRRVRRGQNYEAVGDSIACRTIGGDFFELLELPSGDFGMVLGDVAGKGPPAALLASMLQGMFTMEARIGGSPAQAITNVNSALAAKDLSPRFATVLYGILRRDGAFVCSNAGHNAPIILGESGIQRCHDGGTILGAFRESSYREQKFRLNGGDTVIMFSDGVTEARNPAGEEFGEERLISCITVLRSGSALEIAKGILDSVRGFSGDVAPADDITVAVLRRI